VSATDAIDYRHMARAVQLARRGLYSTDPNPRVGCVIVHGDEVVGEGWHERAGEPHAEIHALRTADGRTRGATVYVTLQPCNHQGRTPPCCDALIEAGVARVVIGSRDPNPVVGDGVARLRDAGIATVTGVMEDVTDALNPGFMQRLRHGRPFVRVKLGASLDGRTAMASGESKWITSGAAREDVQRLRARSSAIMTGVGTVLADDPSLTVRLPGFERELLRVVVDGNLSMPAQARMLADGGGPVLVVTASDDTDYAELLRGAGAEVLYLPDGRGGVDLAAVMESLAQREVNELLVEAGATLAGALVPTGLVDELVLYLAPHLMGGEARPLFKLPGMNTLADRVELELRDVRRIGPDLRLTALVKNIAGHSGRRI
jgi:diaminohydroxyphosphoribosylaminopyrimidine deaminase/5-amino-6-(5-phosphoribosylamino)uracil reductase